MISLTPLEYDLVYNVLSFVIATMGAAALYFFLSTAQVEKPYRPALIYAGLVVAIACYHYFRLFNSWTEAFTLADGIFKPTEYRFREAYRYVDWLLTVPLLMIEIIDVMNIKNRRESFSLKTKLVIGIVLMVILGYPGEVMPEQDPSKWIWWTLATVAMIYVLIVLWRGINKHLSDQPEQVRGSFIRARNLLTIVFIWYAFVYLWPLIGLQGSTALVAEQIGYGIADLLAKAGFGLYIVSIALNKSKVDLAA